MLVNKKQQKQTPKQQEGACFCEKCVVCSNGADLASPVADRLLQQTLIGRRAERCPSRTAMWIGTYKPVIIQRSFRIKHTNTPRSRKNVYRKNDTEKGNREKVGISQYCLQIKKGTGKQGSATPLTTRKKQSLRTFRPLTFAPQCTVGCYIGQALLTAQ